MEGEDAEDDLMDLTKKSFFTKMRSFSREVSEHFIPTHILSYKYYSFPCFMLLMWFQRSSDGFDSVPLKSSSSLLQREEEDSDDA